MSVTRTVVPGEWYGVLGDSVIALLPPAAKSRVAGLWEAVDEGAGFDEVLDALISRGLRELPAFVLVSGEGSDVRVVIRGAGSAELSTPEGPVTVAGSEGTTWVERNVSGVSGVRVRVADATGPAYTVGTGLIRVASVEHPAASAGPTGVPDAEAVAVPVPAPIPTPAATSAPAPAAPIEPPKLPERRKRILPPDPQLEKPEPPTPVPPIEPPVEPPVSTPSGAPIPGAPVPVPDPAFDPLTSPDLAVTPAYAAGVAAAADAPSVPAPARLIFSSGEIVDVDRSIVVGRAPDAARVEGGQDVRLVQVPSPHQEISSTHLEVRPGADPGSAVVTDLGSTNGTVVVQPGTPAEDLRPGVEVQLVPGATIDLGEGVTISVERQ